MYLSRVEVDYLNRQKTKDLSHLGAYHNWVEQSFPEEIQQGVRLRHLWRLDYLGSKQYLLLLSENRPDLNELEKYGVSGTAMTKSYDEFLDRIEVGAEMKFRLTANPSKSVLKDGAKRGKVFPHITIEQQRQWLVDHSEKFGFSIKNSGAFDKDALEFDIVSREWPTLHRATGRAVRLSRVTFEGILVVTDVPLFISALTQGIGREKAFGMGLLTVLPVTQ